MNDLGKIRYRLSHGVYPETMVSVVGELVGEIERLRDELNSLADDPARVFSLRERGFVDSGPVSVTPDDREPAA